MWAHANSRAQKSELSEVKNKIFLGKKSALKPAHFLLINPLLGGGCPPGFRPRFLFCIKSCPWRVGEKSIFSCSSICLDCFQWYHTRKFFKMSFFKRRLRMEAKNHHFLRGRRRQKSVKMTPRQTRSVAICRSCVKHVLFSPSIDLPKLYV